MKIVKQKQTNKEQKKIQREINAAKEKAANLKIHLKEAQEHLEKGFADGSNFAQNEFNSERYTIDPVEALDILKYRNSLIEANGPTRSRTLDHIQTNRPQDLRVVERITNEILNDEWFFEAANVMFNKDGTLIDGQHTLAAIVKANKPVEVLLKTGCRNKSVQKIDVSRVRTPAQRMKFAGLFDMAEPQTVTNFRVKISDLILRSQYVVGSTRKKKSSILTDRGWWSDKQILDTHAENKAGIEWFIENMPKSLTFRKASLLAPLVDQFAKHPEKVKDFYHKMIAPEIGIKSKNRSPEKLRKLIDDITMLSGTSIDSKVLKVIRYGRSEVNFWYQETASAIKAFINNKSYTPKVNLDKAVTKQSNA